MSVQSASEASFPREEALLIACLLAVTGGYLEAYTWIVHRVFANAQTANLIFLWANVINGDWDDAQRFVLPLLAFGAGVILACWLRWAAPERAARTSIIVEIVFLFIVAILHNHVPDRAGTLGISLVAAFQTVSFPRVEGLNYSSVMATNNFRQTIEGLFVALAGGRDPKLFRRPYVFAAMCVAFGGGAVIGAIVTKMTPAYALAVPVTLLAIVLFYCESDRAATGARKA